MDAGYQTVNEIFNGSRIFEIPFFQRAYVWERPQWERLLDDIKNICRTKSPYFMGSIILKQHPTNTSSKIGDIRTVIDGQQRLTTLSILLKVLCLKTDGMRKFDKRFRLDDDSIAIRHDFNDMEAFEEIMGAERLVPTSRTDRISAAYRFFAEELDPDEVDFDSICYLVSFVVIDLGISDDEQQIFDTVNSLGVDLSTAELLKNYFFDRDSIDEYKTYWQPVFEKDETTRAYWGQETTSVRLKRSLIDQFFFSWLQIRVQERALNVSAKDKQDFSRIDTLFDSCKRFIKGYLHDEKGKVLEEIREYAEIFRRSIDTSVVHDELPAEAGLERMNAVMFALGTTTLIPYILFVEREVEDPGVKRDLYAYLEAYIMRRVVTRQSNRNYNLLFTDRMIHDRILSKEEAQDFLNKQAGTVNQVPDDGAVRTAFHDSVLINQYAVGVLYLIESKIRGPMRSTELLGIERYSLEHLMPKKWVDHWPLTEGVTAEERDRTLRTFGNLTIITQSLNSSIRNADWTTKKEGRDGRGGLKRYASGIETLSGYLDLDVWDESAIDRRAEDLAEKALRVWAV